MVTSAFGHESVNSESQRLVGDTREGAVFAPTASCVCWCAIALFSGREREAHEHKEARIL